MIKYFFECFVDMWRGDWVEKVLATLTTIYFALLFTLLSWGAFRIIDSAYLDTKFGVGKIIKKQHHSAFTSFMMAGKVLVPIYHPENWIETIELAHQSDSISVSEDFYNTCKIGQKVNIEYVEGRISGELYINEAK